MEINYFVDAGVSEVIARVTYRLVEMEYKRDPGAFNDPAGAVSRLSVKYRSYEHTFLHTCLAALAAYLRSGKGKSKTWRDEIIYRSRYHVAAVRAGRPWAKAPTPVLLTGGSDAAHLEIIEAPVTTSKARVQRGRKKYGY